MAYLRNTWYVAALTRELQGTPLGRMLLDERVVIFRDEGGVAHALEDRCPHRFVPLSLGKVRGSEIECGYHGLRFDQNGTCTGNPHGKGQIPSRARLRAYPTTERYGFVWYWPGNPDLASPEDLPSLPFLEDPAFAFFTDLAHADGNYQLVIDNLLDLSHVEFLHPKVLGQAEGMNVHETEFFQEGDVVVSNRWKRKSLLHGFAKRFFWTSPSERVDARANMRWSAPARLDFDCGSTEIGSRPEDGVCLPGIHLMTPETLLTTHYFYATAYNRRIGDPDVREQLQSIIMRIFVEEDAPMIAEQQRAMGRTDDLIAGRPVMLELDEPSVRARRILARKIAEESQAGDATSLFALAER